MTPQIAGGPGISCIQVMMNKLFLAFAFPYCALKYMRLTVSNILNPWESLKKGIYRCVPFLLKLS